MDFFDSFKFDSTVSYLESSFHCSQRLFYASDKWSEVLSPISEFLSCFDKFRNWWIGYFYIGMTLIILHEDIVLGRKMFDEVCLKHQCLHLSLCMKNLDIMYLWHHLFLRHRKLSRPHKIWADTAFQIFCFSNIHHFSIFILHLVYAGIFGKIREYFFDVEDTVWHGAIVLKSLERANIWLLYYNIYCKIN